MAKPGPAIKRECGHGGKHQHGTEAAYTNDACRCQPCRDGHAAGSRSRRRARAYGRHVPKSVPNVGSRRRVEALMCLGWSMRGLSRRLGWHHDRLANMFTAYDGVSPRNAARIAALYNELWNSQPPEETRGQRIAACRTRILAARLGYVPPLGWDDDTLDDLLAVPYREVDDVGLDEIAVEEALGGRKVRLTKAEKSEAVRRLAEAGLNDRQIADRLRMVDRSIVRIRGRDGIPASVPRPKGKAA